MRFIRAILLTLLLIQQLMPVNTSAQDSTPKVIGIINPLSGVFQKHGEECQLGYDLAYKETPNSIKERIRLKVEDDQSTPKQAVNAYQKFAVDQSVVATTVFSSSVALAINPISVANKLPVVGISAHPAFLNGNPWAFSSWRDASYEAEMFVMEMKRRPLSKIAILTFENDYSLFVRESFLRSAKEHGLEIVFDETVADQNDNRALITKVIRKNPDGVFLNLLGPSFSHAAKNLLELGFQGPKFSLNSNARRDQLIGTGVQATDGMIFFGPNFKRDFFLDMIESDRNGGYSYTFCCYLSMKLILNSAERAMQRADLKRETLSSELLSASSIALADGSVPVVDRRVLHDFVMYIAKDGDILLAD